MTKVDQFFILCRKEHRAPEEKEINGKQGENTARKNTIASAWMKDIYIQIIKTPCMKLTERQMPVMWWWSASIQEQLLSLAWHFDTCVSFSLWKQLGVFVCSSFLFINTILFLFCFFFAFFIYWFVTLDEVNDCFSFTLYLQNECVWIVQFFCVFHSFLPSDGCIEWNKIYNFQKGSRYFISFR